MIDWTLEALQQVIDEIVSGERLVQINTKDGPRFVVLRYPSRFEVRASDVKMEYLKYKAIKDSFQTEEQMLTIIRERGIWTEKDDDLVEELQEKIDKWREKLKNPDLTERSRATAEEAVKGFEEKLYQAEYKKEIMLSNTAERKARQEKYEYLACLCARDPETGNKLWDNYLTYCRFTDADFKGKLLGELLKYLGGRKTDEIRYIARSNLWRISYVVAQKTNTPLFSRAIIELTPDQTNLAWWSGYYQGIYEMFEDQPSDATISDDDALDKYMEELHRERTRDRQDARTKKTYAGKNSARNMAEQLVMRNNPEYWDLQYDKPPIAPKDGTDQDLKAEAPVGTRAAQQRSKPLVGSKRYKKPDGE